MVDVSHHLFVPLHRALQPEDLHHTRGVAASGFRPLRKIPHCCLPQESGPCLSSSVADHPLRPATRRCLGGPLPRQLADGPRTHPVVIACIQRPPFPSGSGDPVGLSGISKPFGQLSQSSGQIIHVLRTRSPVYSPCGFLPRLACVKHAASVRSEPGSNSPIEILWSVRQLASLTHYSLLRVARTRLRGR